MYDKFEAMRDAGASPHEVYRAALADDFKEVATLKLIRYVFGLSLIEAKEVMIVASGTANSLDEHQERLARELEKALEEFSDNDDTGS